ncbi:MAG: HlyC/CorC family transporter [Rhodobacteraceae bacterium]|nr:HlyC/CorC family transporter [Paracoccaceae bacterium]
MGDSDGSSSSAAQSAQEQDKSGSWGVLGRLRDAFTPATSDDDDEGSDQEQSNGTPVANGGKLGMGNLRRMRVEDVAIPAAEIVSVPVDIDKEQLYEVFRDSGMTRLPVYDGTIDHPIGLIHLKDFALTHGFNGKNTEFNLRKMVRPLLYAPPSMPIGVLLQKMQTDRMHMALVIDEYGGVDGLLTIEDLIEQVIGEIEDEHDIDEGTFWTEEKPGCYLAQARTPLDEFEAHIGIKLADPEDEEEIDTLGGLVFMLMGRVPTRGEVIRHPAGPEFEVIDADPRRVKRLRVLVPESSDG